jgi:hypothetical protein
VNFSLAVQLGQSGDGWLRYVRQVRSSADEPNPQNNTHTNMIPSLHRPGDESRLQRLDPASTSVGVRSG